LEVNDASLDAENVEANHVSVEPESFQYVSLASKKSSTGFMFLQLLQIPPSDEEKLKENSNCDPAINSIVSLFSEKFHQ